LLSANANPNSYNTNNSTKPIDVVCKKSPHPEMITALITKGVTLEQRHLFIAIQFQPKLVQKLLDEGLNANTPDASGWLPLSYAVTFNAPQAFTVLLDAGAAPNKYNTNENTKPIDRVVRYSNHPEMVASLIAKGIIPEQKHLFIAIEHQPKLVLTLLEAGLCPNTQNTNNEHPLSFALNKNKAVIPYLLNGNTHPQGLSGIGLHTVIDIWTGRQTTYSDAPQDLDYYLESFKVLIQNGINIHEPKNGRTALIRIAEDDLPSEMLDCILQSDTSNQIASTTQTLEQLAQTNKFQYIHPVLAKASSIGVLNQSFISSIVAKTNAETKVSIQKSYPEYIYT